MNIKISDREGKGSSIIKNKDASMKDENDPTKPRILIVDDSTVIRSSVKRLLQPLNSRIVEANNGQEGLKRALEHNFDLIISDVDMPAMNGIEMCRHLKNIEKTRNTPLVIVSSFDSEADIERGFQVGASAYLSKSEAQERLCEVVQGFLNKVSFNKKRLIMIVDDSPVIRQIVKEGLEVSGYQVITATNGKTAIKILDKNSPDLIVSDIEMPEMNGFELCKWIKSNSKIAFIPFIVMSSKNDAFHTKRMIQNGAAAYIHKPFNVDQLIILIEKILTDQYRLLLKEKERLDLERNMIIASITSLAKALEAKDLYTRGHSEAVARIVSGMLSFTNPDPDDMEHVLIGGKLHDIGKIGIRDKILHKPGPLTYKEFTHIKTHPIIGANILSSITTLKKALAIILSHHERLDGKGYPEGLKGLKIPLWARMTAVADTYDALTSDRPYRKGMSQEKALQIIDDVKGSQLCPDCVELFLKWVEFENEGKLQEPDTSPQQPESAYESIQTL